MKIVYAEEFYKHYQKFPEKIKNRIKKQIELFSSDWQDPRLHVKKLVGERGVFSFRITREYRILFMFIDDEVILCITVGHRKDVYK